MVSELSNGPARPSRVGQVFWWRMCDNLFRRLVWFLLPIVALGAIGVSQALNTSELYRSTGTISASSNPLLPEQPVSGVNVQFWETPAAATSRIIGERLQTNTFLAEVAEGAGLGDALRSGLLPIGIIRANVWTAANGNSILNVNAQWADPATSRALVVAIIDEYEDFLAETLASDAAKAEAYYSEQRERLAAEQDRARKALRDYVDTVDEPDDNGAYPITVQTEIDSLAAVVASLDQKIAEAETQIDDARVKQTQQATEAARSFTVIDEPRLPSAPESTLMGQLMSVISYSLMGVAVAAGALLLTTALDHSVSSVGDLLALPGVARVATVPSVRVETHDGPQRRRRARGERLPASW